MLSEKSCQSNAKSNQDLKCMGNNAEHSKADFHFPEEQKSILVSHLSYQDYCLTFYSIGSETGVCFMVANLVFYLLLFPLGRLALTN